MIGHRRKKLEYQERFRRGQGAPCPENLHQSGPNHDFLDQKTMFAGALERINLLQLGTRSATELVDLLFERGVSFAVSKKFAVEQQEQDFAISLKVVSQEPAALRNVAEVSSKLVA